MKCTGTLIAVTDMAASKQFYQDVSDWGRRGRLRHKRHADRRPRFADFGNMAVVHPYERCDAQKQRRGTLF